MTRIAFVTLGCPKNQVDSEVMLGRLDRAGFVTTGDLAEADAAVVNTCAFLESAVEESIDTILEVARHKKTGKLRKLVVAGCLSDRYRTQLMEELPEVDAVMGTGDVGRVVEVVNGLLDPDKRPAARTADDVDAVYGDPASRVLSTGPVSPYLKISEGCDAKCTFCIIPQLRGGQRSRSRDNILAEARALAAGGARELVLIAQDLTAYGIDLHGRPALAPLLRELDRVEGIRWIRLMYANPFYWTPELIDAVAGTEKVVPYADMPIQHIADPLLKRMGRHTGKDVVVDLVRTLRERVPGIALRTNVILGFPGETEAQVEELLDFLEWARFDKLVAFPFSPEDTAAASRLPDPVPEEVARERVDRVLAAQGLISLAVNREQVGKTLEVLIERPGAGGRPARGRSVREAPEVDGCVRVAGTGLRPGAFYPVTITGADAYDLVGVAGTPTQRTAAPAVEDSE